LLIYIEITNTFTEERTKKRFPKKVLFFGTEKNPRTWLESFGTTMLRGLKGERRR